ncbi:cyclic AMP-dependent transcription factor ATF-3-like [Haliotis cracherodii]|uniref:cyclic AMP-dependent transcription factor ATF-3-like n=1 Tax=Haliotis rufescens TaxID=6454 RepID=UPI00201F091C|nr:cyclic AMP-dependent transcription factor ATF-3-like [Haliotis rufescens]
MDTSISGSENIRMDEYHQNGSRISDPRLRKAVAMVTETQRLTPLLKEELRLQILTKRHANGQAEIDKEDHTPKQFELTPEEIEKKQRRREQNRLAAQRCRQKKKMCQNFVLLELEKQQARNRDLEMELRKLRREKMELQSAYESHVTSGLCSFVKPEGEHILPPCSFSDFSFIGEALNLPED